MLYKVVAAAEKHSAPCAGKPVTFDVDKDSIDEALDSYNSLEDHLYAEFKAGGIDEFEISLFGPTHYAVEGEPHGPMLKHYVVGRDEEAE